MTRIKINHDAILLNNALGIPMERFNFIKNHLHEVFSSLKDGAMLTEILEKSLSIAENEQELVYISLQVGRLLTLGEVMGYIEGV